jgi:hypothetical protein
MAQFASHSPTNNEDYNRQILKLLADPSQDAKSIFKLLKLPTAPDFPASPNWNEKLFSEMELKTAPRITKDDRRISGSDISATVVTPTAQIGPPQNIVHVHVYNSQPDDSKSKGKVDNKLLAVQGRDWKLHADDETYGSSSDSEGCVGYASNQKNIISRSVTSMQRGAPAPKGGGGVPNEGGPVTCFSTFSPKQKTLEPMGFRTGDAHSCFSLVKQRIFCLGLLTFVIIQPLLHQFSTANRKSRKLRTAVCPRNQSRLLLLSGGKEGTTRLTTRKFLCLSIQFLNSRRRVLLKVFQIATPNRFFLCVCVHACMHIFGLDPFQN